MVLFTQSKNTLETANMTRMRNQYFLAKQIQNYTISGIYAITSNLMTNQIQIQLCRYHFHFL